MDDSTLSEKEGFLLLQDGAARAASELEKQAAITVDTARRSLDRLDTLERNKPTLGQVGRYGAVGGVGGAAIGALGNAIEHGSALKGATPKAKALNLAANTVKGALGGGALPLMRTTLDRRAEMGTLRRFMDQDKVAGRWLHSRAEHILAKNPSMDKGEAFAIATQQAHATGHTPKSFGTNEGKATAKAKYNTPKDDEQRANPGGLDSPKLAALGAAPLWRAQAGFTPPGMQTAAQRLKKSMSMGTVDTTKGLKPLNIKVGHTVALLMKQAGFMDLARSAPAAIKTIPGAAKNLVTGGSGLPAAAASRMGHLNEVAGLGVLAVPGLDSMQARLRSRLAGDKDPHAAERRQLLGEGAHAALDVGGLGLLAAPAVAHLKHAFASSAYGGNPAQNPPGAKPHSQLPAFKVPELQIKMSSPLKRVGELVTGSKAGRLRDAALRHADRAADGKLPRELKAARKLRGMAKAEEGRVGKTQGALVGAAGLGAVSDTTGLAEKVRSKEAGIGVGAGMTASQYSGPLSYGAFKMTSGIPPFRRQNMTKNDDAIDPSAWMVGQNKEASGAALSAMSPAGKLTSTQRTGAPKVTGFTGPSIADIAKPKGFGQPLPGAQKNQF